MTKNRRYLSLAVAIASLWLAGCAAPVPPAPVAASTSPVPSIRPPAGVAWQRVGSHDFEIRSPGFGTSERYESEVGWVDVYRYGMGRSNWATGVADPSFDAQFRSTISEVRQLAQAGQYTELKVGPTRDVRISGLVFRTVSYQFRRQGRPHESRTFMTGLQGRLLKYRMTFPSPVEGNVDDIARDFVEKYLRGATEAIDAMAPPAGVQHGQG